MVSLSTLEEPDNWMPVVRGKFDNPKGVPCAEQQGKVEFPIVQQMARYVRFEVLSYYGWGAALQYLNVD